MDTKHKILFEALTLFAEKGYANVYVGEIAERVGIKAPSLYKHFKNKRAIFDAIIAELDCRFLSQAGALNIKGDDPAIDVQIYQDISEDKLVDLGRNLFLYFLHDEYASRFRKMLTIEQFRNKELGAAYMKIYVDDTLSYQSAMFQMLTATGFLQTENVEIMTLHFYAPIYMLLTICDRDPSREEDALRQLEEHIRQFNKLYGRKDK